VSKCTEALGTGHTYESGSLFDWSYTIETDGFSFTPVFNNFWWTSSGQDNTDDDVVYAGTGNDFVYGAGQCCLQQTHQARNQVYQH
jgi:hypothetical protein